MRRLSRSLLTIIRLMFPVGFVLACLKAKCVNPNTCVSVL
jgi:hypothetical protein